MVVVITDAEVVVVERDGEVALRELLSEDEEIEMGNDFAGVGSWRWVRFVIWDPPACADRDAILLMVPCAGSLADRAARVGRVIARERSKTVDKAGDVYGMESTRDAIPSSCPETR
jgi:hypothetical protein